MPINQSAIDKYVTREVQLIVKVVFILGVFYSMVLVPIQKMNQDIDFIENNHLKHIESDISEIRKIQQEESSRDSQRDINIQRVITILEEHEKETKKLVP